LEPLFAKIGGIEPQASGGNVQEAFRHLKGWYRAVTETQSKPCYHTIEHQTSERVDLYVQRQSPGDPLPIHLTPVKIDDDVLSDSEIRTAVGELTNGRAGGALGMRAEHVKAWLQGIMEEEDPESQGNAGKGDNWDLYVELVLAVWAHGTIPCQLLWSTVVLIPKGGGDYRGIGLLEPIWKVLERIIDHRLDAIKLHDCLHGCRANRGTGTALIEAKLVQQLSHLELKPFYGVFLDLKKAFDLMDWDRCILILEGYGAGPWMIRLIRTYWRNAIMVCRASGNYGTPFKAGHGVTQGGPLSAKLFSILVDAVAREWLRELREGGNNKVWELDDLTLTFFAIFYIDDAYLASKDAEFLQRTLDILASLFERVGLETNTSKMQTMICTPGRIRTQLPTKSYRRLQQGRVTAAEWNARDVECTKCGNTLKASLHGVYQQTVVAKEMLECRPAKTHKVTDWSPAGLTCPFPGCGGILGSSWMMRRHF
jgi:hypothetical protein